MNLLINFELLLLVFNIFTEKFFELRNFFIECFVECLNLVSAKNNI